MNYLHYDKQDNDLKYRIVSLKSRSLGDFKEFESDRISYLEGCVIEVLKVDGEMVVDYDLPEDQISVQKEGNLIYFSAKVPTEHLWVRAKEDSAIAYKVPDKLKEIDNQVCMLIPGGARKVELFGDRYFNKVYILR